MFSARNALAYEAMDLHALNHVILHESLESKMRLNKTLSLMFNQPQHPAYTLLKMHSSWSFTAGVALLSTCSAKALVPRGDDVPDNCSLVPQVFYPKVINTCCDKATTITVEECQTEIVLPTPGCIDTTITQTVTKTKTDDWHPRKSGTKTAAPASTSVPPASTSNPVVYKRDHSWGGNSGRWDNRRKPWDGLTVYNPVFEGKNIDSDGNGDVSQRYLVLKN